MRHGMSKEARAGMDVLVHDIHRNRHATAAIKVNGRGNIESSTRECLPVGKGMTRGCPRRSTSLHAGVELWHIDSEVPEKQS